MTDRLALVIPCFNEAARLDQQALRDAVTRYAWLDLVLVDDGSTDTTAAALGALAATAPSRMCVVSLASNGGKAEAVRRGLQVAMTRATYCGFWDADLSAPLDEVVALRELFTRFPAVQWVWGIRLRALGRQVTRQPLRHYLGRVFATATSLALGVDSYDTQCGAKLFRSSGWLTTVLAEPFLSRWIFDVEMVTRLKGLLQANGGGGALAGGVRTAVGGVDPSGGLQGSERRLCQSGYGAAHRAARQRSLAASGRPRAHRGPRWRAQL